MANDDWYRRTAWTETDRWEFQRRLQRCRGDYNKAQHARIQAGYLAGAGEIGGAMDLLNQLLTEFPDESQLAQSHLQLAECLIHCKRIEEAVDEFRAAFQAEKAYPNFRSMVWIEFPWFVVTRGMSELYAEALKFLDWGEVQPLFPVHEYRLATVLAFIADERGDHESARLHAARALAAAAKDHSGFRYHPKLGLVNEQISTVKMRLKSLSRAFQ